ncbi:hypothetical protein BKA83DRAFT_4156740 [Pisolithus microcarpus]|nr:hypothetical protein BKA83DRAFT_4156740 [Pisolithus microcarpus]
MIYPHKPGGTTATISEYDIIVGLSYIWGLHLNDARTTLGSKKDKRKYQGVRYLLFFRNDTYMLLILSKAAPFPSHSALHSLILVCAIVPSSSICQHTRRKQTQIVCGLQRLGCRIGWQRFEAA